VRSRQAFLEPIQAEQLKRLGARAEDLLMQAEAALALCSTGQRAQLRSRRVVECRRRRRDGRLVVLDVDGDCIHRAARLLQRLHDAFERVELARMRLVGLERVDGAFADASAPRQLRNGQARALTPEPNRAWFR
jgi:hypothetical protein